jgi:hypothetical protein
MKHINQHIEWWYVRHKQPLYHAPVLGKVSNNYYKNICKFVSMIRTIVKPNKNSLTLQLPDDLVGKTVEVIAFEIDQDISLKPGKDSLDKEKHMQQIEKGLSNYRTDLSGFKFNRDEANDYE